MAVTKKDKTSTPKKEGESKPRIDKLSTVMWILLIIFLLYGACWLGVTHYVAPNADSTWTNRGQFGDMFGAVNALFSGLAFAGIIYTILLQREELKAQRAELQLTRAEFKKQNTTLKRQRFEGTFFNMLNLHFKIINSLKHKVNLPNKITGRTEHCEGIGLDAINLFLDAYESRMGGTNLIQYAIFSTPYNIELKSFLATVSPYLQSLIALHRMIESYTTDSDIRERYMTILRSYISLTEAKFLFYHLILVDNTNVRSQLRVVEKDINVIGTFPVDLLIDRNHTMLRNFYGTN